MLSVYSYFRDSFHHISSNLVENVAFDEHTGVLVVQHDSTTFSSGHKPQHVVDMILLNHVTPLVTKTTLDPKNVTLPWLSDGWE